MQFWPHINPSLILPDTLCGFRPCSKVLVFGGHTKVYREKTSEQNITSHLCSLIGPISGNDIAGPHQYQIIQKQSHLSSLLNGSNYFLQLPRVTVFSVFPFSISLLAALFSATHVCTNETVKREENTPCFVKEQWATITSLISCLSCNKCAVPSNKFH